MFSFFKTNLDFTDLSNQKRLERILEKYIAPKLEDLGFEWTKEVKIPAEELEIINAHIPRPLAPHQEFYSQYFERIRGDMMDKISIERCEENGRLGFRSLWQVEYLLHEQWHMENYGEEPVVSADIGWCETDSNLMGKFGKKYRRKIDVMLAYDLSRYPTDKVMNHFFDQTVGIRIPMLERCKTPDDLLGMLKSMDDPVYFECLFDLAIILGNFKEAGSIMQWSENRLKSEDANWEPDEYFQKRVDLLRKMTKK